MRRVDDEVRTKRTRLIFAWGATLTVLAASGCPAEGPDQGSDTDASTGASSGATTGGPSSGEPPADTQGASEASTSGASSGEPSDTTAGDATTTASDSGEESTGTPDEPGPDLREAGPYAVETDSGNASLPGCAMGYDTFTPAGVAAAPVVVLAHGFQGNRASMAGWAEHWASWGVRVVTPDLCHASIFDTDHAQNGADLRALVTELSLSPVIYAGYSAGGLAAVVATADDASTVALLGLDMVDNAELGLDVAASIAVPAFDIVGEGSMCNTSNNGLAVFGSIAGSQALRVTEADHCDFQSPADFLCGVTCNGTNTMFDDEEIAAAVRGLSTAVVLWQTNLEPTGAQWWTPGEHYYELLAGLGIVQAP